MLADCVGDLIMRDTAHLASTSVPVKTATMMKVSFHEDKEKPPHNRRWLTHMKLQSHVLVQ